MSGYKADIGVNGAGGKRFEHWCDADGCEAWGTYGYKTKSRQLWFCYEHRQQGEDALAGRK